jgi:hypothetical protein
VSHPAPPIQTATVRPSTSRILHCGWYTVTAAPAPHSAENHNCCNRATAIAIRRHACALPSSDGQCGSSMHQPRPGWAPHLKPAAVQQQLCCPLYIQPRRLPGAPRARCSDRGPCGHQAAHALASAAEGEHLTRHMDHMEPSQVTKGSQDNRVQEHPPAKLCYVMLYFELAEEACSE